MTLENLRGVGGVTIAKSTFCNLVPYLPRVPLIPFKEVADSSYWFPSCALLCAFVRKKVL